MRFFRREKERIVRKTEQMSFKELKAYLSKR